jgi:hypothetical protein
MSNPTTPFGWQMPTATDLVTDLPADFEVFGQAVATSLADLLGGTSGQVLAKNSNTDMDFVWVTSDDANAIQNSIVDAKGDLVAASANDTPARLAVGNNGETLVADSSTSTGLRYQGSQAAGKNILINGGFDIWQRGTSSASTGYTTADRWYMNAASTTFSQETTTVPTGVRYALKALTSGTTTVQFRQAVETLNAIQFAGKTVVLSGEYQASTTTTIQTKLFYSTSVDNSVTGSWTEITATTGGTVSAVNGSYTKSSSVFAVPSTTKSLMVLFDTGSVASAVSLYYGKIQLELGSVATEFERAGGNIQSELAACQRYATPLFRASGIDCALVVSRNSTTGGEVNFILPVQMRGVPTAFLLSGSYGRCVFYDTSFGLTTSNVSAISIGDGPNYQQINVLLTHGSVAGSYVTASWDTAVNGGFIMLSAEL